MMILMRCGSYEEVLGVIVLDGAAAGAGGGGAVGLVGCFAKTPEVPCVTALCCVARRLWFWRDILTGEDGHLQRLIL